MQQTVFYFEIFIRITRFLLYCAAAPLSYNLDCIYRDKNLKNSPKIYSFGTVLLGLLQLVSLQFLEVFSILTNFGFKPLNFTQLVVFVLDNVLNAYYTMDQTTFPCKKQSHVDGLPCCKQE